MVVSRAPVDFTRMAPAATARAAVAVDIGD
jgi:hypothetical protein